MEYTHASASSYAAQPELSGSCCDGPTQAAYLRSKEVEKHYGGSEGGGDIFHSVSRVFQTWELTALF